MMPEVWFVNLGIKIEKLNRVAFSVFGFEIYWYGILMGLAVLVGLMVVRREARLTGQNPDDYLDFLLYAIICSIIGARLYYVVFSWDSFKDDLLKIFALREGGIAIYGSIIGAALCAVVYTRIKKLNFWKFGDTLVLGLVIGQVIGRWGNFINREVFGGYTDGLFAMRYLKSQVGNIPEAVLEHTVVYNSAEYIQVQPTFLYESLWNLGLFIFLMLFKKHKKFDGEICALYFLGYGTARFWIEGMRTDQLIIAHTGIAVSQILSAVLVIVSLICILFFRKRSREAASDVQQG